MGLRWNGIEGQFVNKHGELVAIDPSVFKKGPGGLLMHRERLNEFLETKGYDIFWILIGRKEVIEPDVTSGKRIGGELVINGVYRLIQNELVGSFKTEFIEYDSTPS